MNKNQIETGKQRLHTRDIAVDVFRLPERKWEVFGVLKDVRAYESKLKTGVILSAGEPLHQMEVSFVLDETMTIVKAYSHTKASPYPGVCEKINPAYEKLIGMTIRGGFKKQLKSSLGGIQGCSHITELISSMAAVAVQAIAPELPVAADKKPGKLDSCHALSTKGNLVAEYYPKWSSPK